jgi:hypothetical protein
MPDTACDAIPPLTTVREAFATSGWSLDFVFDHHPLLQHYDVYEAYLLDALTGAKTNHRRITPGVVSFLFFVADPVKLRRHSDPLPDPLPEVLYRGVAGVGQARRPRGHSWTSSLACACFFARRFLLPDPAIYHVPLSRCRVYAYTQGRHEEEWLLEPSALPRLRRMPLTLDDIVTRQQQFLEEKRRRMPRGERQ